MRTFKQQVVYAMKQVDQGHPLSDFMDEEEIIKALSILVALWKKGGEI